MTEQQQRKSGCIMVVENSSDDFEVVQRAFRKAGVTQPVEQVESGEAALEYLRDPSKKKPLLILLDLNMPGMGGRKMLQIVKQDESMRCIPVVVLTTSNYEEDVKTCYQTGANSYLQKPVSYDSFCEAMKNLKTYWLDTVLLPKVAAC